MSTNTDLPTEMQHETMEVDVLIVGGGCAGLSAALHLANLREKKKLPEQMIVVLEKGREIGAHSLSGAVLDPKALEELVPHFREEAPLEVEVTQEALYFLTKTKEWKSPFIPPSFQNSGNYIVSISKLNRWMASKCEEKGVSIFPGFTAVEALYEGDKIVGVRTGDKGRDKKGLPKANFEPGLVIKAKVVVFAEGTRGSLFKQVNRKLKLQEGKNPEVFEEGVKEIIQMPPGTVTPGQVIHTMGFPLKNSNGGTFLYTVPDDKIILGLVAYLDSRDPLLDPHRELQKLKTHPFIQKMVQGGQVIAYGGKTLPAGGYYSTPKLYGDGFLVCGDSASFVDVKRLKGIHLAMKSGLLAAETIIEAIENKDFSSKQLKSYEEKVRQSYIEKELYRTRNFHQTLNKGLLVSMPLVAFQEISGGRGLFDKMVVEADHRSTERVLDVWGGGEASIKEQKQLPQPDGKLFFDKLSSVYLTGTIHDENSPNHLLLSDHKICQTTCAPQYNSPCTHFCPASVYEMVESNLQINYTNCIHCKTCDIKCPFENIQWTPPEGGGGPGYTEL